MNISCSSSKPKHLASDSYGNNEKNDDSMCKSSKKGCDLNISNQNISVLPLPYLKKELITPADIQQYPSIQVAPSSLKHYDIAGCSDDQLYTDI